MARGTHASYLHVTITAALALGPAMSALGQAPLRPMGTNQARSLSSADQPDGDRDYRSATGLLNRGMHELAAAEYRAYLDKHAADAKAATARYGLAVCLFKLGQPMESSKELDQALASHDFEFVADAEFLRAQCAVALADYRSAADRLARFVRSHPTSALLPEGIALHGESLYRLGEYDSACEAFRSLSDRTVTTPPKDRAGLLWSLADQAQGRHALAAERLRTIRERSPRGEYSTHASLTEAQCRHAMGEHADALTLYQAALANGTDAVRPYALLGIGQLERVAGRLGEAARALDELASAFADLPIVDSAILERGRVHMDAREHERALAVFSSLVPPSSKRPPEPVHHEAAYRMAQCELQIGRFEDAATHLVALLARMKSGPLVPGAMFDLAWALQGAGKGDDASRAFSQFRSAFPDHALVPDALAARASLAHRGGRFEECAALCAEFVHAFPSHARAADLSLMLADSDYLSGNFAKAAGDYERFESEWPDHEHRWHARARRGLALVSLGRQNDAVPLLESAVSHQSALGDQVTRAALAALGEAAFERGEWAEAERRFASLLIDTDKAPASSDARLRFAIAVHRQGRHRDALAAYDELRRELPSEAVGAHAEFERSQVLVELGDLKQARLGFERVLSSKDSSAVRFGVHALRHLASIASREGRPDDAAALLAQVASSPEAGSAAADAILERAQTLMSADQFENARLSLEEFITRFPTDTRIPRARAHIAISLSRLGRHDEAVKTIETLAPDLPTLDPELRNLVEYECAWSLHALSNDDAAAKVYRDLLARHPGGKLEAHATLDLASIELRADRVAEALPLARSASALAGAPDSPSAPLLEPALYLLAVCEFRSNAWADAAPTLRRFVDLFPQSATRTTVDVMLGDALLAMGDPGAAADAFRNATSAPEPSTNAAALMKLGTACALAHRWKQSEDAYTSFLSRFPEHDSWYQARFGIGWARENDGRHESAIDAYREVVGRHQGTTAAQAQFQVGECLFALKRLDEAARELLKVDILYAYPEWSAAALYEAGRCLSQLGKPEEAARQFRAVTEKYGTTEWARLATEQLSTKPQASLPGHRPARSGTNPPSPTKQ